MSRGKAVIFSAPSGAGKTTIVRYLLSTKENFSFSISATTRKPRGTEKDGIDYYFLTEEQFREKIKNNELLEWQEVYPGTFYGTLRAEVNRLWNQGIHVLFDVDVIGGINLKKELGDHALSVFVRAKDIETLKSRLQKRQTESAEQLTIRINKAADEMKFEKDFDYSLINDDLATACNEISEVVDRFLNQ